MSLARKTWKSDDAIFVYSKTKTLEISLWRLSAVRFILILLFLGDARTFLLLSLSDVVN